MSFTIVHAGNTFRVYFLDIYDAAALQAAIDERSWFVTWLRVDPLLDPLRDDPRFATLVQV